MPSNKTVEELTSFYFTNLYPNLKKLEEKRKKLRFKLLFIFFIILWNMATLYFFFFFGGTNSMDAFVFLIIAFFILSSFLFRYLKRDYRSEFKKNIIEPLIKELDSNLHYSPNLYVQKKDFDNSLLFEKPHRFRGNDFIMGEIDSIKIQFSDVHAEKNIKIQRVIQNTLQYFKVFL